MDHRQPLTIDEVQEATRPLLGSRAEARLLEAKHRNQVFAIGEQAIFKAYLRDGSARQARKVAALGFLAGRGLPVPRLLGHGVLPKGHSGVPWTLETRVVAGHVRPTRAELDTPDGWEFHRALGRWLPTLHAFGGFPCFGTWDAGGPATLAAHVLPRARAVRAHAAALDCVPRVLLRRADQELERLEPAIRAADWLRPRLLHGDYGSSNVTVGRTAGGRLGVVAVFDLESAAPGDPVEDFVPTADHGLESRIFTAFVAGYLDQGRLDPDAPQRFAFYQLEHCLDVLGWAYQADREWFAQAQRLIEQVLAGGRPGREDGACSWSRTWIVRWWPPPWNVRTGWPGAPCGSSPEGRLPGATGRPTARVGGGSSSSSGRAPSRQRGSRSPWSWAGLWPIWGCRCPGRCPPWPARCGRGWTGRS